MDNWIVSNLGQIKLPCTFVSLNFATYMHAFLLGTYLRVKLLGHKIHICYIWADLVNQFFYYCNKFPLHSQYMRDLVTPQFSKWLVLCVCVRVRACVCFRHSNGYVLPFNYYFKIKCNIFLYPEAIYMSAIVKYLFMFYFSSFCYWVVCLFPISKSSFILMSVLLLGIFTENFSFSH